jgi:hypothetical protein
MTASSPRTSILGLFLLFLYSKGSDIRVGDWIDGYRREEENEGRIEREKREQRREKGKRRRTNLNFHFPCNTFFPVEVYGHEILNKI